MMESSLNVLTLNCWGIRIPFLGSQLITQRLTALIELVNKNDYDVVVFQEVWDINDYVALSCKILDKLPHTHYFHGGFIGCGLCVFSRYPIIETLYHEFPLNGHAHRVLHGDWYASKGCGLAILRVKDMTVNLYTTHMIARYNHMKEFDEYAGHRAAQAFSLSQFVKHTSVACDAVLVTGDFNTTPTELPYRIIRSNAVLSDAWLDKNAEGSHGGGYTSDTPQNCFTSSKTTEVLKDGQRIDYIFYRANERIDIRLAECKVLTDKIPGTDIDYSDHYAVNAKMFIKKNVTAGQVPELDTGVKLASVKEMISTIDKGSARARYNKYFYFVMSLLCFMMMLMSRERYIGDVGLVLHAVLEVMQGVMVVMGGTSLWMSAVSCRREESVYMGHKCDLEVLLKGATLGKVKKMD